MTAMSATVIIQGTWIAFYRPIEPKPHDCPLGRWAPLLIVLLCNFGTCLSGELVPTRRIAVAQTVWDP